MQKHLVIMVKEPLPGRVKTRLARDIGAVDATWWFRHQVARLVRRVGNDPRWKTWLAVAPDRARATRSLPAGTARLSQGEGDLGARMARIFRRLGPGPVLIVGADIPAIDARRIAQAYRQLRGHDAVFGPAPDGGYWLIGVKPGIRPGQGFLTGVRWSSAEALSGSISSLASNRRVAFTETLPDVDSAADLASSPAFSRRISS